MRSGSAPPFSARWISGRWNPCHRPALSPPTRHHSSGDPDVSRTSLYGTQPVRPFRQQALTSRLAPFDHNLHQRLPICVTLGVSFPQV